MEKKWQTMLADTEFLEFYVNARDLINQFVNMVA